MLRNHDSPDFNRRDFIWAGAALLASSSLAPSEGTQKSATPPKGEPTRFQVACMTLPYSGYPLQRALTGLQQAGYRFVAWGTNHMEADGKKTPIVAPDATPDHAKQISRRCRDLGLEPVMMFSGVYPDAPNHLEVMKNRLLQAEAAGISQLLTFGNPDPKRSDRKHWVEQFKTLGRVARDHGVLIVVKQHGGLSASGVMTMEIIRAVADEGVKLNYDAGNVMDYLHLDPAVIATDIEHCSSEVRSFCIKDHRRFPKDEDCGPGLGEIDHYRLLAPIAFSGRALPLCCENIFAPVVPRPSTPEGIDAFARRA
ncbi:MAG TPA: TIM barrel protein, partial [Gemmataceae bacterium]|nr:TIM barrel protein [Gemmataceae bacterium]